MRIDIGCFSEDSTVNDLLIPNFKNEEVIDNPFFTEEILVSLCKFIHFISSGYPSISQLIGKEVAFLLSFDKSEGKDIDLDSLKNTVFTAFKSIILNDIQSICGELLSPEALGEKHEIYKRQIFELYINDNKSISGLIAGKDEYEMTILLKEIEELHYISLNDDQYSLSYNFLKYYIWHPKREADIWRELEDEWKRLNP